MTLDTEYAGVGAVELISCFDKPGVWASPNNRSSIDTFLEYVEFVRAPSSLFSSAFSGAARTLFYGSPAEFSLCCDGSVGPTFGLSSVPPSSASSVLVYSVVRQGILKCLCVSLNWLNNCIQKRVEFCVDNYPPLDDTTRAVKEGIDTLISDLYSGNSDLTVLSW